jgi:hypothetical protein
MQSEKAPSFRISIRLAPVVSYHPLLCVWVVQAPSPPVSSGENRRVLVPLGGGKDSIVVWDSLQTLSATLDRSEGSQTSRMYTEESTYAISVHSEWAWDAGHKSCPRCHITHDPGCVCGGVCSPLEMCWCYVGDGYGEYAAHDSLQEVVSISQGQVGGQRL